MALNLGGRSRILLPKRSRWLKRGMTVTGRFGVAAKQLMGSFHSEHSPVYRCQSFVSGLNAQIGTLNQRRLIASKPTLRWLARNLLAVTTRKPGAC